MTGRGRGRRRAVAGSLLAVVLLGALVWAVALRSPLFQVRRIEVRGNARLAAEEVAGAVAHVEGRNLLALALEDVADRVARNPWVDDVVVERDLPSTLVLRIHEQVPVAWVGDPGGGAVLGSDGTVLERRERHEGLVVLGRVEESLDPGIAAPVPPPVLRVVASLAPRIRRAVAEAEVGEEGVVLQMRSGARVLYGPATSLPAKGATLRALMAWIDENEVPAGLVDLRAPATPAIRPARAKAASSLG